MLGTANTDSPVATAATHKTGTSAAGAAVAGDPRIALDPFGAEHGFPPVPHPTQVCTILAATSAQLPELLRRAVRGGTATAMAAGTAPSGAHRQPWFFVAIGDPTTKATIREAAEAEERAFYPGRATPEWLEALEPLGTDFEKSHLTTAPWLVVVFRSDHETLPDGRALKGYYARESVGIAVGFLIAPRWARNADPHARAHDVPARDLRATTEREAVPDLADRLLRTGLRVPDLDRKTLDAIATFR